MADTAAFPLGLSAADFGWGSTAPITSGLVETPGFALVAPQLLFGGTAPASQSAIAHPGFSLPSISLLFGGHSLGRVQSANSTGFLINLRVRPKREGDDAFEIYANDNLYPAFPGDPNMAEILYPRTPLNARNIILTKMDSQEYRAAEKALVPITQRSSTVRYRVDTDYLATFLQDLHDNRSVQFRLQTPGATPFGVDSEDNNVRLLLYSSPLRELGGKTYLIDVSFLFIGVHA